MYKEKLIVYIADTATRSKLDTDKMESEVANNEEMNNEGLNNDEMNNEELIDEEMTDDQMIQNRQTSNTNPMSKEYEHDTGIVLSPEQVEYCSIPKTSPLQDTDNDMPNQEASTVYQSHSSIITEYENRAFFDAGSEFVSILLFFFYFLRIT